MEWIKDMDQDKKLLIFMVAGLMTLATMLGLMAVQKKDENPVLKSDAIRFKEEYEALNGTMNETNKMNYPIVEIKEDNPFVYKTDDEIVKFLENGTGIIYFGFSSCPWCRTAIPMLMKAAESTSLGEINYVDIKNIRDSLTLDDNDQVVVSAEGTNGYKEILKKLDKVLDPYYLISKNGKQIDTKEKRLYAPTVIAIKNGNILDIHVDTVKSQENGYTPLSAKEQEELFGIYQKMFLKLLDSSCDESC